MSEYEKQANDFLKEVNGEVKVKFLRYGKHFADEADETESRDIYQFKIKRRGKSYTGNFGQSIAKTETNEFPTAYDILACLTTSDPGTLKEFCQEFDYDTDSIRANKIYRACVKEWAGVERVFGDVIEKLQEIW